MSIAATIPSQAATAEPSAVQRDRYAPDDLQLLLAESQLQDLARMRQLAMEALEEEVLFRTREFRAGRHPKNDLAMTRFEKAIRQIMVLEQEVCGMRAKRRLELRERQALRTRKAVHAEVRAAVMRATPGIGRIGMMDRLKKALSDYNDYNDYYHGSVAEIVAQICKDLGIEHKASIWQQEPAAANAPADPPGGDEAADRPDAAAPVATPEPIDWKAEARRKIEAMAAPDWNGAGGCGPPDG